MNGQRQRLVGEVVFAALMLLLSVFFLWASFGISGFTSYTSAGAFPLAVTGVMVVCALIIAVQTTRSKPARHDDQDSDWAHFVKQISPPVIVWTALAIVLYMVGLEWLGFVPASYAFLVITMRLLGSRRWGLNALVSALSLVVIYVVFRTAFAVVLPTGHLWQGVF